MNPARRWRRGGHGEAGTVRDGRSLAETIERLEVEFADTADRSAVAQVVRSCRRDLRGSPAGALPELVERLARADLVDQAGQTRRSAVRDHQPLPHAIAPEPRRPGLDPDDRNRGPDRRSTPPLDIGAPAGAAPTAGVPDDDRVQWDVDAAPAAIYLLVFEASSGPGGDHGRGWILESWRNGRRGWSQQLAARGAGPTAGTRVAQAVATRVLNQAGAPVEGWHPAGAEDQVVFRAWLRCSPELTGHPTRRARTRPGWRIGRVGSPTRPR